MDATLVTTLISTSGAVVVAVAALATNTFWINRSLNKLENKIDQRLDGVERRLDQRLDGVERRLDVIEGDIKEWAKIFSRLDSDVQRLKDK